MPIKKIRRNGECQSLLWDYALTSKVGIQVVSPSAVKLVLFPAFIPYDQMNVVNRERKIFNKIPLIEEELV